MHSLCANTTQFYIDLDFGILWGGESWEQSPAEEKG